MNNVLFSVDDLKTPQGLERVLRQFQAAMNPSAAAPSSSPAFPSIGSLVGELAPLIRKQLQAPGGSPLNLQSLLPTQGQAVLLEGTHNDRITLFPASNYAVGTVFYETDRAITYGVVSASGALVWQYIAGMDVELFANRPIDLGLYDRGYLLWITVQNHICWWSGAGWAITGDAPGTFVESVVALGLGYQVCDGTATDYLVVSGADLALTAFTTPDEVTAPSGVFHKSIAAYTGTINAPTSGTITGSTANTTATNIANTTGVTVDPHAVAERLDDAGSGVWVFENEADADHVVNDPGHNHTQDPHNHAAGTLAVGTTGAPRNLGVLRYFRR